jgi:hypothetical protein
MTMPARALPLIRPRPCERTHGPRCAGPWHALVGRRGVFGDCEGEGPWSARSQLCYGLSWLFQPSPQLLVDPPISVRNIKPANEYVSARANEIRQTFIPFRSV